MFSREIDRKNVTDYSVDDLLSILDRHEEWTDRKCLNLYAASNILNAPARRMLGSTIGTRVAEGEVGKKCYQMGVEYLEEIERVALEGLKHLYRAEWADCRVHSGTLANIAVELAFCSPGDTIMSISLSSGSHTSHTRVGFPVFFGLNVVDIPFDRRKMNVDLVELETILRTAPSKPKLLILGGSLFLFRFPVKAVRDLLDKYSPETLIVFDAAHVDGIIAGGAYPNPLDDGASIITGSTYKTLGGPPGGFIVGRDDSLYKKVKRAVYPGLTTNYHYNRIGALAVTCLSLMRHGKTYAKQIVLNSRKMGATLNSKGFTIVGKENGYSDTHQVLIELKENGIRAPEAGRILADANILTSPQLLPSEPPENVRDPRGIRIGTQELTRLGMKEAEMEAVAGFMAEVLIDKKDTQEIGEKVAKFREKFPEPMF